MTLLSEVTKEATGLLKLGLAFMASAFLMMGAAYAVRTMVLRIVGFEAAGYYQCAWTLGGLYVGFILQARVRLLSTPTAIVENNAKCNRIVHEQALISLLLAGPGMFATLTLVPIVSQPSTVPSSTGLWICCAGFVLGWLSVRSSVANGLHYPSKRSAGLFLLD